MHEKSFSIRKPFGRRSSHFAQSHTVNSKYIITRSFISIIPAIFIFFDLMRVLKNRKCRKQHQKPVPSVVSHFCAVSHFWAQLSKLSWLAPLRGMSQRVSL